MRTTTATIRSVKARAVVAPISRPVKNAFGVIEAAPLVLIDVATDRGVTGRSYIFAYAKLTLAPLVHLIEQIGGDLTGKAIAPFDLMADMDAKFRLLGWQGLVGMAVSGLDMAFWDALGQAAGQPLARLLGGSPRPIRAYDSYGVVDPIADEKDLRRSLDRGFRGIKIKGGDGDIDNDERVVKAVRGLIGPDIALMLDFNQSLDPSEARRRIDRLAPYDLHWIEEPVAAENLQGHVTVRATSPISIQSGENWWFPRGFAEAIAAGASDFIMPDLMKVGGVTGWLRVAGQAEANQSRCPVTCSPKPALTCWRSRLPHTGSKFSTLPAPSWPSRSRSTTARSPHAGPALASPGTRRRWRNIWCERLVTNHGCFQDVSIVDAELIVEAPKNRGQHLRQIFRDQTGTRLARRLAMHPGSDAGGFECRHALRQQARYHSCQHVAGARGGEPGRRVGGDGGASVR